MKYNYAVTVVLYYPDIEAISRIRDNYNIFPHVLLIDNTDNKLDEKVADNLDALKKNNRIIYQHMPENVGMSGALNFAYDWAIKNNVDYLLTMDQDTDFPEVEIQKIISVIESDKYRGYALFSSNWRKIYKKGSKETYGPWKHNEEDIKTTSAMTSGTFYDVKIISKYLPLPDLFIAMVDEDISCELERDGQLGVMIGKAKLSQRIGTLVEDTFWNRITHKINLSPVRYYYTGRNTAYMLRKYEGQRNIIKRLKKMMFFLIVRILINEKQRAYKLNMLLKGMKEIKEGNMKLGKYEE